MINLRSCLNFVFRIYYDVIFCQIEAFLRSIALATCQKNNNEMAEKTNNKTKG